MLCMGFFLKKPERKRYLMRVAVIGIGSNSVRMLLADLENSTGFRIRRDRAGTRLFAGLDAQRRLSPQSMKTSADSVAVMAKSALEAGAQEIQLFATSATRDAANADEFASMIRESSGLELQIIPGETEAQLSFLGASGSGRCGVIDIGGGSTEIIVGNGMDLFSSFSCQMGAVRLSRQYPLSSVSDMDAVIDAATRILEKKLCSLPDLPSAPAWFGTGGTFTTLAAMVNGVPWTDRTHMHGTLLPYPQIAKEACLLAPMTPEERKALPGLQPNRADIIVHGICILLACMRTLHIPEITVSEYGNLDGFLKYRYHLNELR